MYANETLLYKQIVQTVIINMYAPPLRMDVILENTVIKY